MIIQVVGAQTTTEGIALDEVILKAGVEERVLGDVGGLLFRKDSDNGR